MKSELGKTYIIKYICPTCSKMYDSSLHATECFASTRVDLSIPDLKVGDFVTTRGFHYGWYSGDEKWVLDSKPAVAKASATGNLYRFIHVVTFVGTLQKEPHRIVAWLKTLAVNLNQSCGWVSNGHIGIERVPANRVPLEVVKAATSLLEGEWKDWHPDDLLHY